MVLWRKVVYCSVLSTSCLFVPYLFNKKNAFRKGGEEMRGERREVARVGWEGRMRPLIPDPTCLCQRSDLRCCNSYSEEITVIASDFCLISLIRFQLCFFLLEVTIVCTTHFRTCPPHCKILSCSFCVKLCLEQQPQAKIKWVNASLWNHCLGYNCWFYPATA